MRRILGSFWFHSPLMPQWMGGKVSASHCSSFSFLVGGGGVILIYFACSRNFFPEHALMEVLV